MDEPPLPPLVDGVQLAEQTINEFVGTRLQQLRRVHGVSQQQLAARLGISFQQLQKYESGKNRLSAGKLYRAALLFDVSPGYFFDGLDDGRPRQVFSAQTVKLVKQIHGVPPKVREAVIALLKLYRTDA